MEILLMVLGGLALLAGGGEMLVRGAAGLAARAGISPLIVGMVIVGSGTSTPELVTSIAAAVRGSPEIAWGNVVGSNVANTLLILGAAALLAPFAVRPVSLWREGLAVVAATVAVYLAARAGITGWALGIPLLAGLIAYLILVQMLERSSAVTDVVVPRTRTWVLILFALAGVAALILGGRLLVDGAIALAQAAGMSQTLIGLTIVAVGTSLPELMTSLIAAFRRHGEIAFGNVVGSNLYNLLLIGGATGLVSPAPLPLQIVSLHLPILLGAATAMILFALPRFRFGRAAGALLLIGYGGTIAVSVAAG